MKLVAVTRILNESDIVEAFVRHTAHYVDHHIFLDNGSTDGTLAILGALHVEGFMVTVHQMATVFYHEMASGTFLYERAVAGHNAQWVLFLDTDEFIDDRELDGGLKDFLDRFARERSDILALQVRIRDYAVAPTDPDVTLITSRMPCCREISKNTKVIIKGGLLGRGLRVMPGSHALRLEDDRDRMGHPQNAISYAHYGSRSPYQWISKFVIGWAKVKAAGPKAVNDRISRHYREPFEYLATTPESILRSAELMEMQSNAAELTRYPLAYRGGELRYTPRVDHQMKCVLVIMRYLDDLATRHGEMLEWMHDRTNLLPSVALAPTEIVSAIANAARRAVKPSREVVMTAAFLTTRSWKFFHRSGPMAGSVGALHLRFLPDGGIGDYSHPNESRWRLDGEAICLLNADGKATTCFTYVEDEGDRVLLAGALIVDPAVALGLLEQEADFGFREDERELPSLALGPSSLDEGHDPVSEVYDLGPGDEVPAEIVAAEPTLVAPRKTGMWHRLRGG